MSLEDGQGLAVAAASAKTIAAIDHFVDQALTYGKDYAPIVEAAEAEPGCVMAGSLAASLMMWMEAGQSPALAEPYLERCRGALAGAEPRERAWFEATEAWVTGDMGRALQVLEKITDDWPRDVFAMKLAQYHYFNLGRLDEMLRVCEKVLPANPENGYLLGCQAFGLEQADRLDEAEAVGRRAVALNRGDAWAHHAVAHVMETQGRILDGIAWMEGHADTWVDCNSFMLGHNWWHTALFHLDRGDTGRVLDIYDNHVWGLDKTYSQDQANAASLLWRLELRGVDVGDRWQDVADHVAGRLHEHVQLFLDAHYLYALGRAGNRAAMATLVESCADHAAAADELVRPTLQRVAVPLVRGLAAYVNGDFDAAHAGLAAAVPRLQEIGGSHAQRDLFLQTWLDILLRTGRTAQALPLLRERAEARPAAPYGWQQVRQACDLLDRHDEAAAAHAEADRAQAALAA